MLLRMRAALLDVEYQCACAPAGVPCDPYSQGHVFWYELLRELSRRESLVDKKGIGQKPTVFWLFWGGRGGVGGEGVGKG